MVAGATGWEGEGDYPWTKKDDQGKLGDYPLEKYELDKNLSDLASKYIEEKGKEEVAKTDDLLQKLMDTKNYLPATKYSVSALYFKFFQLEREVFYILNCLATVCSLTLSALPYTSYSAPTVTAKFSYVTLCSCTLHMCSLLCMSEGKPRRCDLALFD
jgi:hypothetical protein